MNTYPLAMPVATPAALISSTRVFDEFHCACAVTFSTELSDLTAFAVSCTDSPGATAPGAIKSTRARLDWIVGWVGV
jgi:hypothetical protein